MIRIETLQNESAFAACKDQWDSLLGRTGAGSIFLSHGWLYLWWQLFAGGGTLLLLLARDHSKLHGIAPLMLQNKRHRGVPVKCVSFIDNKEAPHNDFIADEHSCDPAETVSLFLSEITDGMPHDWDIISLRGIPGISRSIRTVTQYCDAKGYPHRMEPGLESPRLTIDAEWDSYYQNTSQRFKKRIRHNRNRLGSAGEITVECLDSAAAIEAAYDELLALDRQSWKAKKQIGLSSGPRTPAFFRQLPWSLPPSGKVVLWLLRLSGQAIAYEYHVRQNSVTYALRAAFDERYRQYAPGAVLDFFVVQAQFGKDIALYDMCGSADDYKLHWTTKRTKHTDIFIYNRTPKGMALSAGERYCIPALKKIKYAFDFRSA